MTQEDLARRMHSVVYAQRKLAYLQEKLQELQSQPPLVLRAGQHSLSSVDVEVAAHYELLLHGASAEIALEESTVQQQTDSLLSALPELIKDLIRKGWPLIAHWPADGILSLALVYQDDKFRIIPDNEVPLLLTNQALPLA